MKKIYVITAIILLMAILLTLVSCKEDTPDTSTDSSTESSTPIEDSSVDESLDLSMDDSSVEEGSTEDITSDIPEDSSADESFPEESNLEESVPEESNPSEDVSEESIPSESSEEVSEEPEVSEEEPKECVHSYKTSVVKATCKAGGYTLHKCEKCGDEYKTDETEKGEHQFVADETYIKEYGCPVYYDCTVCGASENRYDCGNPVHKQYGKCELPDEHERTVAKEAKGCADCGEHDCVSLYTNKLEDCPKYDPMKDDRVICQKCGKERGHGIGKCTTRLMDGNCGYCGAFVKAGACHECPYELKTEYYYFDANGGDLNGFPEKLECLENEALDVSVTTKYNGEPAKYPMPIREGYAFVCWSKSKTMSAKDIDLELKIGHAAYIISGPGTYYAIWVKE